MTGRTACACLIVASVASMAWAQSTETSPAKKTLFDGLTFYASYDASIDPDRAAGASSANGKYAGVPGRVGQACDNDSAVTYIAKANLNRQAGTVSFWVKPASAFLGAAREFRLFATTWPDSVNLQYHPEHQAFFFMTAYTAPGKDWQWDYQLPIRGQVFDADRWNHVVLVWDVSRGSDSGVAACTLSGGNNRLGYKRVYVNGKVVGSAFIPGIDGGDDGTFGFADKAVVGYAIDELMIWDRPLSPKQATHLFSRPEDVARGVQALPAMARSRQWRVYPHLVYRHYADAIVSPGEAFACDLPLENRTEKDVAGQVTLRLLDLWEKPVGQAIVKTFAVKPKETIRVPLTFTPTKQGVFKIEATVTVDGTSESRDVTSFACLPAGNPPKHPFFGGHINFIPGLPEMSRRLGFSANRCHDMTQYTWWDIMEPRRGEFAMKHQFLYKQASALGFDHMGEWFATPFWAITLPDGTHPAEVDRPDTYPAGWVPTDWDAYRNYVKQAIVRHPDIELWCIWNEPWSSYFFNGSAREYLKLSQITYETAKATNPKLTLYGMVADNLWGRAVLQGGLLKHCDALTYHSYFSPGAWDDAIRLVRTYREFIAKYGQTDQPVRLTNSESGMTSTTFLRGLDFKELPPEEKRPPMDFLAGAERIVQYYVTTMAEGVEAFYYYYVYPVNETYSYSGWSIAEVTCTPKPFAVALAQLTWQLDGGKYVGQIELPGSVHAYAFARNDGDTAMVLWSVNGGQVDAVIDVQAIDFMGNPIAYDKTLRVTDVPMYLRMKGPAIDALKTLSAATWTVVTAPKAATPATPGVYTPIAMDKFSVAAELGESRMVPIDLTSVVTRGFADDEPADGKGGWTDEGDLNDCRDMPTGRQVFLGVPFDVIDPTTNDGKSVIVLRGRTLPAGPTESSMIAVNRKVRGLFFLHSANYAQIDGARAGTYHIAYADGQSVDLPIVIGQNIYDWWFDHRDAEDSRTVPLRMSNAEPGQPFRFPRVWWWENTRQDVPVTSVTLRTEPDSPAALVLIGLTAGLW